MLFLQGIALLGDDAEKWAAQYKDSDAAWAACEDPRWMLWWSEYAALDEKTLDAVCRACCAMAPEVMQKDSYQKLGKRAFVRPILVDQMIVAGVPKEKLAEIIRGVVPFAPVR